MRLEGPAALGARASRGLVATTSSAQADERPQAL